MRKRRLIHSVLASFGVLTLMLFQNCGQGYGARDFASDSTGRAKPSSSIYSPSLKLEPGQDVLLELNSVNLTGDEGYLWTHKFNGLSGGCTERNGNQADTYIVNCAANGDLTVELVLTTKGISKIIPAAVIGIAAPSQALSMGREIQMTLEFDIAPGTGIGPWNSSVAPVEAFIGQVLRIKNNDSFSHRLETTGRPCVSTQSIDPGGVGNCLIKHSYNRAGNGLIFDGGVGPSAPFYVVSYDGIQLYAQYCANCHGALTVSAKLGRGPADIVAGRSTQPMMQTPSLMALTPRQIEAISYALGGR